MTTTDNPVDMPPFVSMTRDARCPFDPPPAYRELRSDGALTRVRLPDGSTPWVVTRYEHQRALLADPRVSTDPRNPGFPAADLVQAAGHGDETARPTEIAENQLSFDLLDDPEHARLRRMVTGSFTVGRVDALQPAVQRIVDELIDAILDGPKPVDLVQALALPVPTMVICELLGVPYERRTLFQEHSAAIVDSAATAGQRAAATAVMTEFIDELLADKLTEPGDDLLSELAARVQGGELARFDAARMGVVLLLAGHETTANMIALGTLALLENPDQFALLRDSDDDPRLAAGAVEELLRYLHITHRGMRRCATEDIEIDGHTIRAGDGLIVLTELGNRDTDRFAEPDHLDITRDARRHLAFGFGVHQCLGQALARMELRVVYRTLCKRIPTLQRAVGLAEVPFKNDSVIYGVDALPVTW